MLIGLLPMLTVELSRLMLTKFKRLVLTSSSEGNVQSNWCWRQVHGPLKQLMLSLCEMSLHRYMDFFSIGSVVTAQEVVWFHISMATGVVTLIGVILQHSVTRFIWTSVAHGMDETFSPAFIFLKPENYRSHTPRSPGKYTDWSLCYIYTTTQ